MELAAINFFRDDGKYAFDEDEIHEVEFIFIDQSRIVIGADDLDACGTVRFTLRPKENNS